MQEGSATFTAGDNVIEARGGQVVVPAGVAHKFVNSSAGRLRQVDNLPERTSRQPPSPHQIVHLQQRRERKGRRYGG
jgi:quercetin dioxygenase-like cupin family protein